MRDEEQMLLTPRCVHLALECLKVPQRYDMTEVEIRACRALVDCAAIGALPDEDDASVARHFLERVETDGPDTDAFFSLDRAGDLMIVGGFSVVAAVLIICAMLWTN